MDKFDDFITEVQSDEIIDEISNDEVENLTIFECEDEDKILQMIDDTNYNFTADDSFWLIDEYCIHNNYDEPKRWTTSVETIIRIKDRYFMLYWESANTEYQENEYYNDRPVEVKPVKRVIIIDDYTTINKKPLNKCEACPQVENCAKLLEKGLTVRCAEWDNFRKLVENGGVEIDLASE